MSGVLPSGVRRESAGLKMQRIRVANRALRPLAQCTKRCKLDLCEAGAQKSPAPSVLRCHDDYNFLQVHRHRPRLTPPTVIRESEAASDGVTA